VEVALVVMVGVLAVVALLVQMALQILAAAVAAQTALPLQAGVQELLLLDILEANVVRAVQLQVVVDTLFTRLHLLVHTRRKECT
jgi:hypothetical protein